MIVGENGVGKTCLMRRLLGEDIDDVTSTDGIDEKICHFVLWKLYPLVLPTKFQFTWQNSFRGDFF
jgi:GTPase SAR1 family protein